VLVVGVITVLTDLPQHDSRPVEIAGDTSVMNEVNADVGPCSYALGESVEIYGDFTAHTLTCSFTDDSIYQLSTVEVPNSAAGKHLGQLVSTVTLWATSDALSAIEEIQTLSSDPTTAAGRRRLAHDELLLGRDRAQAQSQLSAADQILRARLPALHLTAVPTSRS
jgi:hypothetical protein